MTQYGINRYLSGFVYKTLPSCYDIRTILDKKASHIDKYCLTYEKVNYFLYKTTLDNSILMLFLHGSNSRKQSADWSEAKIPIPSPIPKT